MTWINSSVFWQLLWVVPLFLLICLWGCYRRRYFLKKIFPHIGQIGIYTDFSAGKRLFRECLLFLCLLFLFIAAARPAWGIRILPRTASSRDLMILFDCSRSMLCDDIKPSRMAHAKWLVTQLVRQNPNDRFGLIAFAGSAVLTCPLTVDNIGFLQTLEGLDTDSAGLGGTNIKQALQDAITHFTGAGGNHKAIILISDGDELTGSAASALESLRLQNIPVFVVGIGDPDNPGIIRVPDSNGELTTLKDQNGNPVQSPLNEKMLSSLAAETNGIYVRSTVLQPNLGALEKRIRDLIPKNQDEILNRTSPIERKTWPLGMSLFFILLYFITGECKTVRKNKKSVNSGVFPVFLLSLLLLTNGKLEGQEIPPPEEAVPVNAQKPPSPGTPEEWFNLGVDAQQANESPDKILQYYMNAVNAADSETLDETMSHAIRQAVNFNMGTLYHHQAQKDFAEAEKTLQNQNPDQAGKILTQCEKTLNHAESDYGNALRFTTSETAPKIIKNQKNLLRMRHDIQKLKEDIQQMKDLQKQALQKIQDALKQNQEQSQNQSPDQQSQGNLQNQIQSAKDSVQNLQKAAQNLSQQELAQKAENAAQALEQSLTAQQQQDLKTTEQHLKEAEEILSDPEQSRDQQNDSGNRGNNKNEQDNKQDNEPNHNIPPESSNESGQTPESTPDSTENWNKQQAENLLNAMEQDAKDLKEMLKQIQKMQNSRQKQPEKDW